MIDELKALLVKIKTHCHSNHAQCHLRNAICVSVSSDKTSQNSLHACSAAVLASIRDVFGIRVPVLPNINSSTDELDQIRQLLGGEYSAIVVDGTAEWPDNVLGAAAGVVKTPGLLFLLLPQGLSYSEGASPYEVHLKSRLSQFLVPSSTVTGVWHTPELFQTNSARSAPQTDSTQSWQREQENVLLQLVQRCQSEHKTLDVLTARRGRGKSAVLGELVKLLRTNTLNPPSITLTATHPNQVVNVIKHAGASGIGFTPLDKTLQRRTDLLLVDEAGSVPVPVLQQLSKHYQHLVIAGTVDGYEGAGRALTLRLNNRTPESSSDAHPGLHTLTQPIRWPDGDRVEAMVNHILRLDLTDPNSVTKQVQPSTISATSLRSLTESAPLTHQRVTSEQLLSDDKLLDAIFGLLLQAHYQTSSRDLKHLLNQDGLLLFTQTRGDTVTAACLVACEGGLTDATRTGIEFGHRRPRHQRLPMLLHRQYADETLLSAHCWRVVRIAVLPELQQCGLGTQLLQHVFNEAMHDKTATAPSYLGAAFGASPAALSFWQRSGYQAFHAGFKLNPRSGQRSVCVAKPVKDAGIVQQLINQAQFTFIDTLNALQQLNELRPAWLIDLYDTDFLNSALLDQCRKPPCPTSYGTNTQAMLSVGEVDDLQRLHRWRDGRLNLHDVWGPLLRQVGGAHIAAAWDFTSDQLMPKPPGKHKALNAKQLTKQIQEKVFSSSL